MVLATRNFEEKRDFIRMKVNCDAIVTTKDGQEKRGVCYNLSGGGALLEINKSFDVNEPIQLTIHSQYGHAPVFIATGSVVRSNAGKNPEHYWVAIRYK